MPIIPGAVVMEISMVYPNIFHASPVSLDLAMEFMSVSGPSGGKKSLGFFSRGSGTPFSVGT